MNKDYYKILGIDVSANLEEVKKAFRIKAKKYHPDVSKDINAEKKFKEINEAYEVLSDDEKRKEYDKIMNVSAKNYNKFNKRNIYYENFGIIYGVILKCQSYGTQSFSDFCEELHSKLSLIILDFNEYNYNLIYKIAVTANSMYRDGLSEIEICNIIAKMLNMPQYVNKTVKVKKHVKKLFRK